MRYVLQFPDGSQKEFSDREQVLAVLRAHIEQGGEGEITVRAEYREVSNDAHD